MARALRIQFSDACYHVSNRGNNRKAIFRDDEDRKAFLTILAQSTQTYSVVIHGYVLMTNHWHLLAQTPLGNLSEFMRHFNITYTSYFNRRHKRSGHLYQGRYKSFLVEKALYLAQVSRYIHLNPIQVRGLKTSSAKRRLQHLFSYRWSSLPGFVHVADQQDFVEYATVLADYGGNTKAGRSCYRRQTVTDIDTGLDVTKHLVGQSILGSSDFVAWVRKTYLETRKNREVPALNTIHTYLSKDQVLSLLAQELGVNSATEAMGIDRQIIMAILYKYAGMTNQQIGTVFNCDYSTVSQHRRRLRLKMEQDSALRRLVAAIEEKMSRIKI